MPTVQNNWQESWQFHLLVYQPNLDDNDNENLLCTFTAKRQAFKVNYNEESQD